MPIDSILLWLNFYLYHNPGDHRVNLDPFQTLECSESAASLQVAHITTHSSVGAGRLQKKEYYCSLYTFIHPEVDLF